MDVVINANDAMLVVAIYLREVDLDPMQISERLGVVPSRVQRRGEPLRTSENGVAKIGLWAIIAGTNSLDVSEHVEELLTRIGDRERPLNQIDLVEEAYFDILVALEGHKNSAGTIECFLTADHVKRIARLGLEIRFTCM